MPLPHQPSTAKVIAAGERLLAQDAVVNERRERMRRIAHFAGFFGNVLNFNQIPQMLHKRVPDQGSVTFRPQLALPVTETSLGYLSMVEHEVRVLGRRDTFARRTDLVLLQDGEPQDYWGNEGKVIGSLKPGVNAVGEIQHSLESISGPVNNLTTLDDLIVLTDAAITPHGITPYPGFIED